jgi:hypothetical protein
LHRAGLSKLFWGILLLSFSLSARAQSMGAAAPDAQNRPLFAAVDLPSFSVNPAPETDSNDPAQLHPVFSPPSLLSDSTEAEPSDDADDPGDAESIAPRSVELSDAESVAPRSASDQVELLPLFAKWREHMAERQSSDKDDNLEDEAVVEHYHWKGLLWQSFAFFGVQNTYRLFTDAYLRHLLATGPFWTNYWISVRHWDMYRWSDGDDFIVAYVAHPLQGSVTEFIEIQNSPHDRLLQISSDPAYWKSRFMAMLWATVYSVDQKVGPLGESAIGNEGGYTYVIGCPDPCPSYNPAVDKVTNNTGWVKFITTPVVGTMWTLAEDFLDRYVSDRVQGDDLEAIFPKILRGSLNPARTMANGLRWRKPWYRDYQHPDAAPRAGIQFIRDDEEIIRHLPRYEIFPHYNAFSLPVRTSACYRCRSWTQGGGVGFSARFGRIVEFDSDVDYQPNASPLPTYWYGGNLTMGTFGLRAGFATPNYALKVALRPGFVSYSKAYFINMPWIKPAPSIGPGRITHFATALAINGDYGITRNLAIRGVFGNTPIRYLDYYDLPPGSGQLPYFNWLSKKYILTNENWTYQVGPVLRF